MSSTHEPTRPLGGLPASGGESIAGPRLRRRVREVAAWVAARRFLLALAAAETLLLCAGLDRTAFWIDEGMNALLGENILKFGYPVVWDGTYLVEPYFDAELTPGLVRISHTWAQFYLTAGSLALFGHSAVAARLPSVVCGVLAVVATYHLARRISGDERVAKLAALLLAFHAGFLLYSRTARYFSLAFLLTSLTALAFLRWSERPTRKNVCLFTLCSVLLFYSHFPVWPFLMAAAGGYYLLFDRRRAPARSRLAQLALSAGATAALVAPWLIYAQPFRHNIYDWSGSGYGLRLLIFTWKVNTWVFPFVSLAALLGLLALLARAGLWRRASRTLRLRRGYFLLLSFPLYVLVIILAPHPMISSQYTAPGIPFAMIVAAYMVLRVREYGRAAGAVVLALLLSTNVLQAAPFILVEKAGVAPEAAERLMVTPAAQFNAGPPLAHYLTEQLKLRSHLFEYAAFAGRPYQHRLKLIVEHLRRHGSPGETVLAPWHDADAVRFYTRMRVVYHFKPSLTRPEVKALVYRPGVEPDWIIPNAYYEPDQPFFKYRFEDYERVYLDGPKDYIYENEPNLDFFIWQTNTKAPPRFFILRRKRAGGARARVG